MLEARVLKLSKKNYLKDDIGLSFRTMTLQRIGDEDIQNSQLKEIYDAIDYSDSILKINNRINLKGRRHSITTSWELVSWEYPHGEIQISVKNDTHMEYKSFCFRRGQRTNLENGELMELLLLSDISEVEKKLGKPKGEKIKYDLEGNEISKSYTWDIRSILSKEINNLQSDDIDYSFGFTFIDAVFDDAAIRFLELEVESDNEGSIKRFRIDQGII